MKLGVGGEWGFKQRQGEGQRQGEAEVASKSIKRAVRDDYGKWVRVRTRQLGLGLGLG